MSIDWAAVWAFVWPILKQAIIAMLVSALAILGYDTQLLPARVRELGLGGARKEKHG
jgi:hypothetical protein